MFELIEKIRNKSDKQKNVIAFSVAFSISLVILLFWLVTVVPDLSSQKEIDNKVKALTKDPSDSLGSILQTGGGVIFEQVSKIKEVMNGFSQSVSSEMYFKASSTINSQIEPNFMDENQ